MIYRILTAIILFAAGCSASSAQELLCTVEINTDQVPGTNKSVFETLTSAMNDYMNTTQFTNAQFAANEKIECKLFFTIKKVEGDVYSGDLQVQYTRPVFNSTYTSTMFNFKDTKIEFQYSEGDPLTFNVSMMESNLTQILNFYAYLILAMDFDSFSPRGGEQYWDRLATIVQQAQSAGETGWKAFEDNKNRAALLAVFTQPATAGMRDMLYKYHRTGLDEMSVSPDKGRQRITESLDEIKKLYDVAPMSVGLSLFKDSKLDELVNIYSKAPQEERTKVFELLSPIYPTENDRLQKIKNGSEKR